MMMMMSGGGGRETAKKIGNEIAQMASQNQPNKNYTCMPVASSNGPYTSGPYMDSSVAPTASSYEYPGYENGGSAHFYSNPRMMGQMGGPMPTSMNPNTTSMQHPQQQQQHQLQQQQSYYNQYSRYINHSKLIVRSITVG